MACSTDFVFYIKSEGFQFNCLKMLCLITWVLTCCGHTHASHSEEPLLSADTFFLLFLPDKTEDCLK